MDAERQRLQSVQDAFYADAGLHSHLAFDPDSTYARDLADHLRAALALTKNDTLLEIGAGAGRFSLHLLDHCKRLVALDTSKALLDALSAEAGDDRRLERAQLSVFDLAGWRRQRTFDAVCGIFILHHLPSHAQLFESLFAALRPGGRIAFIEPNRLNPSFLVQVAVSREMEWEAEKGMFTFSSRTTRRLLARAGFTKVRCSRFGLCPPQILDRAPQLLGLQHRLEQLPVVRRLLPFALISAERP